MNNKDRIKSTAIAMLNSTKNDETRFSYLCGRDVESFGFFLWEWCEDWDVEETDIESILAFANSGEHGIAWIVPVEIHQKIEGYALFTGHAGSAAEDSPNFEDVFDTAEDAKLYLKDLGLIATDNS